MAGAQSQTADCLVLGAGMVGVATALQLQARGKDVVLVDRQPAGDATSFGNAGIIQAEGIVPYMLPLDLMRLFRMLLNQTGEAHVHYSALLRMTPWLVRYGLNSFEKGVRRGADAHLPLVEKCVSEHEAFMNASGVSQLMRRTGYLKIYRDTQDLEREEREAEDQAKRYGVKYEIANPDRLGELEPHITGELVGGIWYPDPVSLSDPGQAAKAYADLFRRRGGRFITADAMTLAPAVGRTGWAVSTVDGPLVAEHAVVALGPWSRDLLKALGADVPLATKRGYHMHYNVRGNATMNRPIVDTDHGYVMNQMVMGVRLTTGAEFALRDARASPKQLDKVESHARALFPLDTRADKQPWLGSRPCFPDMVPGIGPIPGKPGLWGNFGHHHLGLTLGPVTGRLLAEMITGEQTFTDPAPYRFDRF